MSLLEKLFNNDSFKKGIFARLAKQAQEQGIKNLLITIEDNGEFKTEVMPEDSTIVKTVTYVFLKDFYEKNKNKIGLNYQDTIKKS